jgi:ATP/maltotriose-dependent transcriptional regulator MalT
VAVAEGDTDTTNRVLAERWQEASAAGDERILGLAGLSWGIVALFADDYPRARELFEQALARFDALGEVNPPVLLGRSSLAMIATVQGDLGRAAVICAETLAVCEQRGDRWSAGWVFYVLALIALARGQVETAIGHARDGLRRMYVFHNLTGIAMLLELYAMILVAAGQAAQAAVMHGVGEQTWQVMGRRLFGSAVLETHRSSATWPTTPPTTAGPASTSTRPSAPLSASPRRPPGRPPCPRRPGCRR